MDSDQELVSWLGLILFAIVIWQVYKSDLKAILFNAPVSSSGGSGIVNPTGGLGDLPSSNLPYIPGVTIPTPWGDIPIP
jgi:hypothetical protein